MYFINFLLVSCDSESRSSSSCYQIVVRRTENRQLIYFFARQRNLWVTDASEWRPEVGLEVPCPCVFFCECGERCCVFYFMGPAEGPNTAHVRTTYRALAERDLSRHPCAVVVNDMPHAVYLPH